MEKQYLFEQGKVYFHPDNNNKLIDQLINFPNVLHDDLCDSCIMTLQENNNYFT
jgi:phage terminase large subunit-like protein